MPKTIFITGATDGIGLKTARMLVSQGHNVLLHGRKQSKLEEVEKMLSVLPGGGRLESYIADLSSMTDTETLANTVIKKHQKLDVLINNAGVFKTPEPITKEGLDVRFAVNTIAPYLLTQKLVPLLGTSSRVVNVSSAAQSPVNLAILSGRIKLSDDFTAYAQSKLALTMWSRAMAFSVGETGPAIIALNPGSMLGTKMVKQAFGSSGKNIRIGADILTRSALSDEFTAASGKYYDNDSGHFAKPHADALNPHKCKEIVHTIETILAKNIH